MEVTVQSRRRHDAIRGRIKIDEGNHPLPGANGKVLFAKWQQQILGQPPVEKRADVPIHAEDVQTRKLANRDMRYFGGGHEAILGIAINKHIQLVLGFEVARNIAARQ